MHNLNPNPEMAENLNSHTNKLVLSAKAKLLLDPDTIFFDNQEFLQLMNISKRTAQQWRSTGYIGFSQLGNKIYYRLKDIQELLNANYNPKK